METNYTDNGLYKCVCDFVLENITINQLIEVAKECASYGINSENLFILAGLSEKFDSWDTILRYYKLTLEELNIKEPNKKEAAEYLTSYYCKELVDKKISPEIFLGKICHEIYNNFIYDDKIAGDSIGIQNIMKLYYSIDYLNDTIGFLNETELNYIPEKTNNYGQEKIELLNKCYNEAKKYLEKYNINYNLE